MQTRAIVKRNEIVSFLTTPDFWSIMFELEDSFKVTEEEAMLSRQQLMRGFCLLCGTSKVVRKDMLASMERIIPLHITLPNGDLFPRIRKSIPRSWPFRFRLESLCVNSNIRSNIFDKLYGGICDVKRLEIQFTETHPGELDLPLELIDNADELTIVCRNDPVVTQWHKQSVVSCLRRTDGPCEGRFRKVHLVDYCGFFDWKDIVAHPENGEPGYLTYNSNFDHIVFEGVHFNVCETDHCNDLLDVTVLELRNCIFPRTNHIATTAVADCTCFGPGALKITVGLEFWDTRDFSMSNFLTRYWRFNTPLTITAQLFVRFGITVTFTAITLPQRAALITFLQYPPAMNVYLLKNVEKVLHFLHVSKLPIEHLQITSCQHAGTEFTDLLPRQHLVRLASVAKKVTMDVLPGVCEAAHAQGMNSRVSNQEFGSLLDRAIEVANTWTDA